MVLPSPSETASSRHSESTREIHHRRAAKIACGFGALASVLFALFTIRLVVQANAVPAESHVFMWVAIPAAIIVTLLLIVGTVSMWTTPAVGQHLLIVAAASGIAYAASFTVYNYFHGPSVYAAGDISTAVVQALLGVIPALAALLSAAAAASKHTAHQ